MALKTCTRPAGSVAAYAKVEIRLSQDTVITASGLNYLASVIPVTAAADGSISVQLQATNDLTPNNTFYTVTEYTAGTDSTYYIQVPQTAGPFVLTNIQVSVPAAPAPAGVGHVSTLLADGAVTIGGLTAIGSGDNIAYLSETSTASLLDVRVGTSAAPDTSANAPIKVNRTFAGTAGASFSGQPVGQVSAVVGAVSVVNPGNIQGFGVFGLGHTSSTQVAGANGKADATGVAGVAIAEDPTIHLASGGFFSGIMVTTAGAAEGVTGVQIAAQNKTGLGDHAVNATGFSKSVAVYITAGNAFDMNGAAIEICNTGIGGHGAKAGRFDVGLHVPAQVANALTGAIDSAVVRDDGTSAYSYLVNGTHASAAIAVASGAGSLILGETALQVSTALLEIMSASQADPLVEVRTNSAVAISNRVVRGPSGSVKFGYVGTTGQFLTSTAAGDTTLIPTTTLHIGGTTKVVSVTAANALGFYAATPVAKPTVSGAKGSNAALGSLMTALSSLGLVTDSTSA